MKKLAVLALGVILAACSEAPTEPSDLDAPPIARSETAPPSLNAVDLANVQLAEMGVEYRVAYVEYLTVDYFGNSDNIIVAQDLGNKRLEYDFLPNDPRRFSGPDPNTIDVLVDLTEGTTTSGLDVSATTQAIYRALGTWQGVTCSDFGQNGFGLTTPLGLYQALLGYGPFPSFFGDLTHGGWLPGDFFELIRPGGSGSILGFTVTFRFVEDLNQDGQQEVALREIYYNDAISWADDGSSDIDVETIALHEMGHGLSQAHFGTIFFNPNSGKLLRSPEAVMNAVYGGVNRDLYGTDTAGHCGLWDTWPTE